MNRRELLALIGDGRDTQGVGQPILVLDGRNDDEIEKAFATMAERQVRGLLYGPTTYFQVIADKLIALAARYHIPAIYEWRQFVAAGGLMSYNVRSGEGSRLVGDYAGRILRGPPPPICRSSNQHASSWSSIWRPPRRSD